MKTTDKITFIDGLFEVEEAKQILTSIFSTKIQFHEMKNYSSMERTGKMDDVAQKRIPELKTNFKNIEAKIEEAKANNKMLVIRSSIDISLQDEL